MRLVIKLDFEVNNTQPAVEELRQTLAQEIPAGSGVITRGALDRAGLVESKLLSVYVSGLMFPGVEEECWKQEVYESFKVPKEYFEKPQGIEDADEWPEPAECAAERIIEEIEGNAFEDEDER